jgi:hypothetical protein
MTMPLKKKYLSILRIEVQDLIEDIGLIVEEYKKRKERGEITNYVFLENLAVLLHEIRGVNNLVEVLDGVDPDSYSDLEEMVRDIEQRLRGRITDSNLEEALFPLVKRKLEKVTKYVSHVAETETSG